MMEAEKYGLGENELDRRRRDRNGQVLWTPEYRDHEKRISHLEDDSVKIYNNIRDLSDGQFHLRTDMNGLVDRNQKDLEIIAKWTQRHDEEEKHWYNDPHFKAMVQFANIAAIFILVLLLLLK